VQPVLVAFTVAPVGHAVQTPLNGHMPMHVFVTHAPEYELKYLVVSVHSQNVPSVVGVASEGQALHGVVNPVVDQPPAWHDSVPLVVLPQLLLLLSEDIRSQFDIKIALINKNNIVFIFKIVPDYKLPVEGMFQLVTKRYDLYHKRSRFVVAYNFFLNIKIRYSN